MSGSQHELYCGSCGWSAVGLTAFVDRLQAAGLLKRNAEPDKAEVLELASQLIERLVCPDCQGGLRLDEVDDWPTSRNCELCGNPIPTERLEIFPGSTLCVTCQRKDEAGEADPESIDFCPKCGSPMSLRSTASGVTRYTMRCTSPDCNSRG